MYRPNVGYNKMLWDENKAENTKMCNFPDKETEWFIGRLKEGIKFV